MWTASTQHWRLTNQSRRRPMGAGVAHFTPEGFRTCFAVLRSRLPLTVTAPAQTGCVDEKELEADCARREAQKAGYGHQDVLNARPVPERRLQVDAPAPVPVVVRVHWERDGWQTLNGFALGWVNRRGLEPVVRVQLPDGRTTFCWVPADAVRRVDAPPAT